MEQDFRMYLELLACGFCTIWPRCIGSKWDWNNTVISIKLLEFDFMEIIITTQLLGCYLKLVHESTKTVNRLIMQFCLLRISPDLVGSCINENQNNIEIPLD